MDNPCIICLCSPPSVSLSPCLHKLLCPSCAVRLEHPSCPTCRQPIVSAHFPTSARPRRDFPALLAARRARDDAARDTAAQVLLAGPPDVEHLASKLMKKWGGMFGNVCTRTHSASLHAAVRTDISDELQGLPYTSKFAQNATVEGTPVRFSWLRLPDNQQDSRGLISDLTSFKPDFLLLTACLHLRRSLQLLLNWDTLLRRVLSTALPKRMWVFLAPLKLSDGGPIDHNLNFKDDVAAALDSMPLLQRPLTFHVVEPPGSWITKASRKVAKRSVFHARKERPLRPTND